jgi:hypothetical protein
MNGENLGTGDMLKKVSYTHQALCDLILEKPWVSQGDIARHFGYTESWVSQIIRSDALREYLVERKAELMDPALREAINGRMESLAHRSVDVLMAKLDLPNVSAETALKALEVTSRALGYGAQKTGVNLVQNFVVAMPPKEVDGAAWVAVHQPGRSLGANLPVVEVDG